MKIFFEKYSDRISVYQLPSYSPDYNPIEKLWKKIKEADIHLHYVPTFEDLRKKVEMALEKFQIMKKEVLKLFGFYRGLKACWFFQIIFLEHYIILNKHLTQYIDAKAVYAQYIPYLVLFPIMP